MYNGCHFGIFNLNCSPKDYSDKYILKIWLWKNSYLNRYFFTLSGTMDFVLELSKSESISLFLLLVDTIFFRIASTSAITSDAFPLTHLRLRSLVHFCSFRCRGSSKQEVMISSIRSLSWPMLIIKSSSSSVLSQNASDLIRILWQALSWRRTLIFKKQKSKLIEFCPCIKLKNKLYFQFHLFNYPFTLLQT